MPSDNADNLALALDLDRMMRVLDCSVRPRARMVDHIGIGPFGAMVLSSIADLQPVALQTLGRYLDRDKAQMTRTVQSLEREGLIEKQRSLEDRRVWLVSLTDDGRSLAAGFQTLLGEVVTELLASLDDAEKTQFAALLAKVVSSQHDALDHSERASE